MKNEPTLKLVEEAYDVASRSIGIQTSLVDALIEGKELTDAQKEAYSSGAGYNFLSNSLMEPADNATQRMMEKYIGLVRSEIGLLRASFRILGSETDGTAYNPSLLSGEEIAGKIKFLEQKGLAERIETPISQATLDGLITNPRSNVDGNVFLTQEAEQQLNQLSYKKPLKGPRIRFGIEKLEFMAYVIENAMAAFGDGRALPAVTQLLDGAKQIIAKARAEYPVLTSVK